MVLAWLAGVLSIIPAMLVLEVLASLLVAMIAVQFIKGGVKVGWQVKSARHKQWRQWFFFILAYFVGFQSAEYFIEDPGKISVFLGVANPAIYIALCKWAYATNRIGCLAFLKSRKMKRSEDGGLALEETHRFKAGEL